MLGAEVGGRRARALVAGEEPRLLDPHPARREQRAEIVDRHVVDVLGRVPGDGQQPRHRHPASAYRVEDEPKLPYRVFGFADMAPFAFLHEPYLPDGKRTLTS